MDMISILGISTALAMDAFAVAVGISISSTKTSMRQHFRLAGHFGFFQFFMSLAGWTVGDFAGMIVASIGNWVAFLILVGLGISMILHPGKQKTQKDPTRGVRLILLSLATSVDAFAAGLSLAFLGTDLFPAPVVIGLVAFIMTWLGIRFGAVLGAVAGQAAESFGGIVLIAVGLRVVF